MASGFVVRPFASLLLLLLFCMCMCGRFECVRVCVCVCVECLTSRNIGAERRRLLCHDRRRGRYEIDRPFLSAPVLLCLRSSLCLTLILSLSDMQAMKKPCKAATRWSVTVWLNSTTKSVVSLDGIFFFFFSFRIVWKCSDYACIGLSFLDPRLNFDLERGWHPI